MWKETPWAQQAAASYQKQMHAECLTIQLESAGFRTTELKLQVLMVIIHNCDALPQEQNNNPVCV